MLLATHCSIIKEIDITARRGVPTSKASSSRKFNVYLIFCVNERKIQ